MSQNATIVERIDYKVEMIHNKGIRYGSVSSDHGELSLEWHILFKAQLDGLYRVKKLHLHFVVFQYFY